MRSVLLVAYHFPPFRGSSGVQRTLRFSQHLPKFGWRPVVLTIVPSAYESTADSMGNEVPPGLTVERAFGMDAARHFSVLGRYPQWLALPDRWGTWRHWAVRRAEKIVQAHRISAVWSTFPIATAHEIGLRVASKLQLPWIAEFRDPMWQGEYPPDAAVNAAWRDLEDRVFDRADRIVVTTPSAEHLYSSRFPSFPREHLRLLENGFDEETFGRAHKGPTPNTCHDGVVTLIHSGVVYPSERDPTHFFRALAALKHLGAVSAKNLRVILRATGNDHVYRPQLQRLGIDDVVQLAPPVDYLAALQEMLTADALLLMQAANCNAQIPAKLYEYLRADRPILALTDPAGDTAKTLDTAGAGFVTRIDSVDSIVRDLPIFLAQVREGTWRRSKPSVVRQYSRENGASRLAAMLDSLCSEFR